MAKPSWLTLTPMSGSGDGTVVLEATVHTGRVQRTGTVTITGTGVSDPETVAVTQAAKPEFVQFDNNATEIAAAAAGQNLTISGTSNSSKLTWAAVGVATDENGQTVNPETGLDYPEVAAPTAYTANGAEATSGTEISGDPGASAEFAFSATLVIPANDATVRVDRTYSITDNGGNSVQIVVKQAAGAARLAVSPSSITITAAGVASDDITVTSNTSWTVS